MTHKYLVAFGWLKSIFCYMQVLVGLKGVSFPTHYQATNSCPDITV